MVDSRNPGRRPTPLRVRTSATGRPIAPGGWRRGLVGVLVGAAVGAVAVLTARDEDR